MDTPCSSGFSGVRKVDESSSFITSSNNSRQAASFLGNTLAASASASSTTILHLSHFNLSCVSLGVPSRSCDNHHSRNVSNLTNGKKCCNITFVVPLLAYLEQVLQIFTAELVDLLLVIYNGLKAFL